MGWTNGLAPGAFTDVEVIPVLLRTLRESPPPDRGVFSAYLPAPPVQVAGQKYLVHFREECKAIRRDLEAAGRFVGPAQIRATPPARRSVRRRGGPGHLRHARGWRTDRARTRG